jgi:PadR family transcriptional regulator, regulatory protein AphA
MPRSLSTTSYAVLGLLALRPLTPYEITQQMQRSLDYCWPTSERSLYDQPERLVALGLARRTEPGDGTTRRRYAITPEGRAALRAWLADDTAMPHFQNEPMLRTLFADQGDLDDLHRTLASLRAHIAQRRRLGIAQMASYLDGEGLFQDRAHIVTMTADLISRILNALDEWAADITELSADWTSAAGIGLTDEIRDVLATMVDAERARDRRATAAGF